MPSLRHRAHILTPRRGQVAVLNLGRVRSGDVLLTRGLGLSSTLTAAVTGMRPFSHAAIYASPFLYESRTDRGIAPTLLEPVRRNYANSRDFLERSPDDLRGLRRLPRSRHYLLLRHPGFDPGLGEFEFTDLTSAIAVVSEYPNMSALVPALGLDPDVTEAFAAITRRIERLTGARKVVPGMFCSQLVVAVLEEAGLQVFEDGRSPARVSPNGLLDSKLEAVPGGVELVAEGDLLPAGSDLHAERMARRHTYEFVTRRLRQRIELKRIELELDRIRERIRDGDPRKASRLGTQLLKLVQAQTAITRDLIAEQEQLLREQREALDDLMSEPLGAEIRRIATEEWALNARLEGNGPTLTVALEPSGNVPAGERQVASGTWVKTHDQAGEVWRVRFPDQAIGRVNRAHVSVDRPIGDP